MLRVLVLAICNSDSYCRKQSRGQGEHRINRSSHHISSPSHITSPHTAGLSLNLCCESRITFTLIPYSFPIADSSLRYHTLSCIVPPLPSRLLHVLSYSILLLQHRLKKTTEVSVAAVYDPILYPTLVTTHSVAVILAAILVKKQRYLIHNWPFFNLCRFV